MNTAYIKESAKDLERIADENKKIANSYLLNNRNTDSADTQSRVDTLNSIEYVDNNTDDNIDDTDIGIDHGLASIKKAIRTSDHGETISHDVVSTLKSMMNEEIYESGVCAPSESYFRSEFEKNKLISLNSLNCLYIDNYSVNGNERNIHYLVGCLHLISHMNYYEVYPIGQSMALNAINYKGSAEVQEYGIKCFEDWECPDGAIKLSAVIFPNKWLQDDANEVIKELSKDRKWDIMSERFLDQNGRMSHAI